MADVNRGARPLSPHLMIYRPQWTSISSIMVRITGIALLAICPLIVFWLLGAVSSEAAFERIDSFLGSWLGKIVFAGALWALFYHMLGRLRHVIWDFGYLVDVEISELMGKGMFVLATALTIAALLIV